MKERIVIVGAGGFGREVLQLLDCKRYIPVGFIDPDADSRSKLPLPVLGDDTLICELRKRGIASCACVAIGDHKRREILSHLAVQYGLKLPPIIHENAVVLTDYLIGDGTIIYPNVVVMNDCRIGKGVLMNAGVTLGHDVEIGDFSNVNPGAHLAGRVRIGKHVFIGIGASIIENLIIGDESVVGAGSVVISDVSPKTTMYGVPAKPK
jgi:sugar O-acyltransferase (sialic acid O-acetyltransferase NeuD family)